MCVLLDKIRLTQETITNKIGRCQFQSSGQSRLFVAKGHRQVLLRIMESRYYEDKESKGKMGHSWNDISERDFIKEKSSVDFYVFLTHIASGDRYVVVPSVDLEKLVIQKSTGQNRIYRFYFHFIGNEVLETRDAIIQYSKYLDSWEPLRNSLDSTEIIKPTKSDAKDEKKIVERPPEQSPNIDAIIDGSNVAFDNVPRGQPARYRNIILTLEHFKKKSFNCRVIVDASLRWRIDDQESFNKALDEKRVHQAPSGIPADQYILKLALLHPTSKIISNDDFRIWLDKDQFKLIKRDRLSKFKIDGEFIDFSN